MPGKQFANALSQLTRLVEQLAQIHEQEIQEVCKSPCVSRSLSPSLSEKKGDVEAEDRIHLSMPPASVDPERPSAESTSAEAPVGPVASTTPMLHSTSSGFHAAPDVPSRPTNHSHAGLMSMTMTVVPTDASHITAAASICQHRTGSARHFERKSTMIHGFALRKPWCDQHEFDAKEACTKLQVQWSQGGRGRKCKSLAQVRRSIRTSGDLKRDYMQTRCSMRRFITHPESKKRALWVFISLMLLLFDLITLPVDVGFNLDPTRFSRAANLTTTIFWTLDIFFNFFTGIRMAAYLEMSPSRIAVRYAKSYMLFDICLVLPDWVTLLEDNFPGGPISLFRVARFGRLTRMLRLGKLLRVFRLRPLLVQMIIKFRVSTVYLHVSQGWMGLFGIYLFLIHFLACAWFALGDGLNNGWVHVNGFQSASTGYAYLVSFQWCAGRMFLVRINRRLDTPTETLVDAVLIFIGFVLSALGLGKVTVACMTRVKSKTIVLWNSGMSYIHRHRITTDVNVRLMKFLESLNSGGAGEVKDEEDLLLQALPPSLKEDLVCEARIDYLLKKPFLSDMAEINERMVVLICNVALSSRLYVEREVIFAYGDVCDSVLFLTDGLLWYVASQTSPKEFLMAATITTVSAASRFSGTQIVPDSGVGTNITKLITGAVVSEPVLWTAWEHQGSLLAAQNATALSLHASAFAEVIEPHTGPCMHMVLYAKHFVWQLNHTKNLTDLAHFPELTIEQFDALRLFSGSEDEHFIFISHYKIEAGTEATLMRDSMEPLLRRNQGHHACNLPTPIFIDSEDLVDLATLKEHVRNSETLVLLLTPDVLARPWCLVEIVEAVRNNVNIVPVEVQRVGSRYSYPDEEWYNLLFSGGKLNESAMHLLEQEGINLEDVAQAVRQVFQKIALPFSPHKTKSVREAELLHILKRCNANRNALSSRGNSKMSGQVSLCHQVTECGAP